MPTQTPPQKPQPTHPSAAFGQSPTPNGTARRPGPPKPVVFKDFASI